MRRVLLGLHLALWLHHNLRVSLSTALGHSQPLQLLRFSEQGPKA
jgi:hypothetical protein